MSFIPRQAKTIYILQAVVAAWAFVVDQGIFLGGGQCSEEQRVETEMER